MKLVIVESPTKARTLKRYLPEDYVIEASMGHLRDLPKSRMGVDVEHNFEPEYVVVKGKGKVVASLKKKAADSDEIYLAMDPDREGEAIAWHTKYILQKGKGKKLAIPSDLFKRVTFHEITKEAILDSVKNPEKLIEPLVDAQQARRVVDRLVGYNLSPVLWKKVRRGLSAGRVQSVALRLIVEREVEIAKFKPQEYWMVKVQVNKKSDFWVELTEIAGEKVVVKGSDDDSKKGVTYLDSKKVVTPVEADLKKSTYVVESVERKERKRRPYPPFTTSTLQQAAANVMGWSGRETMRIAQQLYERGYITYHRTDSTSLAKVAVNSARKVIESEYGKEYLPEKPIFYKTKSKSAQEAHEAIRPTNAKRLDLKDSKRTITAKHEKLYRLIWQRLIACQMLPAVYDQTTIVVKANGKQEYKLRVTGSIMKFKGWRVLYKTNSKFKITNAKQSSNNNNQTSKVEDLELPEVKHGDTLTYRDLESEQKATQPPPRYNDASLVKELEKQGIGRPSTYAPIISVILDRGYIERIEKRFHPTSVGTTVVEFLTKHFDKIMDYDFTAEMEEDLDRIARGEKEWQKVMESFYAPFAKKVETVEKEVKRVEIPVEKTGEKCPECKQGDLVIRTGRFGKFYSCSRFPECKHTASFTEPLKDFKCPECGGEVVKKRTRKGRMFYGCSNYPKCDYASWKDPRQAAKKKDKE